MYVYIGVELEARMMAQALEDLRKELNIDGMLHVHNTIMSIIL